VIDELRFMIGKRKEDGCAKQSQSTSRARKTIAKAKGLDDATRHWRQSCETKPIRPESATKDAGGQSLNRGRAGGKRAKQSQLTPEQNGRQAVGRKRVMMKWTGDGPRQNKANFRTDRREQGSAGPPAPAAGLIVRNKANLRNSPPRWGFGGGRTCVYKQSQSAPDGLPESRDCCRRWGHVRETKPISAGVRPARGGLHPIGKLRGLHFAAATRPGTIWRQAKSSRKLVTLDSRYGTEHSWCAIESADVAGRGPQDTRNPFGDLNLRSPRRAGLPSCRHWPTFAQNYPSQRR
jgi:hypothetical protein